LQVVKSQSRLEQILEGGRLAVTAECGPPKGSEAESLLGKGRLLAHCCDALNVTDNQAAVVRMSSLAGCVLHQRIGVEPILQMVVRDRNRLALQSDILGAAALGFRNVLCLSGDHHSLGNHPQAKGVYDIDSMHLLSMVRTMRDQRRFINGDGRRLCLGLLKRPGCCLGRTADELSAGPLHCGQPGVRSCPVRADLHSRRRIGPLVTSRQLILYRAPLARSPTAP
jgi:hypothetical protein